MEPRRPPIYLLLINFKGQGLYRLHAVILNFTLLLPGEHENPWHKSYTSFFRPPESIFDRYRLYQFLFCTNIQHDFLLAYIESATVVNVINNVRQRYMG